MSKLVYIAAPYTLGDVAVNVKVAMDAANELLDKGYFPYCPHLSHFLHMAAPRDYQTWIDYTLAYMRRCDVVIRLEGKSKGADGEEEEAKRIGMPVFYTISDFLVSERKFKFGR